MDWKSLRKGTTNLKVERQHGTETLLADNIRLRVNNDDRRLDLSIDLKGSANRLADFRSATTDDRVIIDHLAKIMKHVKFGVPAVWRLHVAMQGDHWFTVRVESKWTPPCSFTFRVESVLQDHPPL